MLVSSTLSAVLSGVLTHPVCLCPPHHPTHLPQPTSIFHPERGKCWIINFHLHRAQSYCTVPGMGKGAPSPGGGPGRCPLRSSPHPPQNKTLLSGWVLKAKCFNDDRQFQIIICKAASQRAGTSHRATKRLSERLAQSKHNTDSWAAGPSLLPSSSSPPRYAHTSVG